MAPTRTAEVSQALIDVERANQAAEKARQAAAVDKQLKDFGRLSNKSAKAPVSNAPPGTMKTIGKLLIEVGAVENIIKTGEETGKLGSGLATARIISVSKGEGIRALLGQIDEQKGVLGSVIVGHDGLVIASTLPPEMDKDSLGVLSLACLGQSNLATRRLEIGKLLQMVLITEKFMTILTDVEVGILAVHFDGIPLDRIDELVTAIEQTIHG
jgi:predicted regulator of Ras-like GTPase activity (Roadblock/LC7/MglB family)